MRNSTRTYGKRAEVSTSTTDLTSLLEADPMSDKFVPPTLTAAKDCVRYLIRLQTQVYGTTILEHFEYVILLRNFKLLLSAYTPEEIARWIALSVQRNSRPATTKYVKECIEWYKSQHSTQ